MSSIDYSSSLIWIFPQKITCPSDKLRTEFTSPTAKSTSPMLSDTTFFITYLMSRNRLSNHQSGNKSLHSTETLNIYTTDLILEAMDKKEISALVLLDLSKAFDSICHQKLLQKLFSVGASPAVVQWFRSYLSDRTQSVRIDSVLWDPLPITHGVPQGAILSPLLFCIYLNNLPGAPQFCQLESYVCLLYTSPSPRD